MRPFDPVLLRVLPEARRPTATLAAVGVAQGAVTVATAFALAAVIVAVVRGTPLGAPAAYLVGLFVVRGLLAYAGERVAASAATSVTAALREQLLRRWLTGAPTDAPTRTGRLALADQGVSSVEPYISRYLPAMVTAAVVPPLAILVLFVVDWPSALVVLLTVPLLPLFAALIGATTRDATQRRWGALSALSGHFLDVVRGLPTLVSYGRAEHQRATIAAVSQRHRRATVATLRLAFLSSAALELLATICVAIVAVTVGLRLSHGTVGLGNGLVAILLAPEAYWPIRRVGAEFHSAADGAAALTEITDHLRPPTSIDPASTARHDPRSAEPAAARVEADALTYSHPGAAHPALAGLDITAGVGLTTITGPSGVGKTTLLELLAGLREPDAGTVTHPDAHLVTQRPFLTAGSIRENLTLGIHRPVAPETLWAALRRVGLDGAIAALPSGLDALLGDDGRGLSAGQRARLVLARATLSGATVVLLDEPTAHLDTESARVVHDVILELAELRCVVVVTHRPELVALADQHIHLTPTEVAA